jgi:hypothetical protein
MGLFAVAPNGDPSRALEVAQVLFERRNLLLDVGYEVALLLHHLRRGAAHELLVRQLRLRALQRLALVGDLLLQTLRLGGRVDQPASDT